MNAILLATETVLPYSSEAVFGLTIDLEKAPRWHSVIQDVRQLTANPIATGSRWHFSLPFGGFELEIAEFQPPYRVVYKGSRLVMGTEPNFTVELEPLAGGTRLRYIAHPRVSPWLRPLMSFIGPPWGRRDLARYFREFEAMLAREYDPISDRKNQTA